MVFWHKNKTYVSGKIEIIPENSQNGLCVLTFKLCAEVRRAGYDFPKSWERESETRNGNFEVSREDLIQPSLEKFKPSN